MRPSPLGVGIALVGSLSPAGVKADRTDYGGWLHWAGYVTTPGHPYGVAVSAAHAYVADQEHGLEIVDLSDPDAPRIVANVAAFANDVAGR